MKKIKEYVVYCVRNNIDPDEMKYDVESYERVRATNKRSARKLVQEQYDDVVFTEIIKVNI